MKKFKGWFLPDEDQVITKHTTKQGYQANARKLSLSFVKEFNLAIDVGACIGMWTKDLCSKFNRVIAFEPSKSNVEYLKINTKKFNNLEIHPVALGEKSSFLYLVNGNPQNPTNFEVFDYAPQGEQIEIMRLDDFNFKEKINYIKIDVEGYEIFVLKGGKETILRDKPIITIEQKEVKNKDRYEASNYLRELGAKLLGRHNDDLIFGWDQTSSNSLTP
jgi:FkbM family methyltransferase